MKNALYILLAIFVAFGMVFAVRMIDPTSLTLPLLDESPTTSTSSTSSLESTTQEGDGASPTDDEEEVQVEDQSALEADVITNRSQQDDDPLSTTTGGKLLPFDARILPTLQGKIVLYFGSSATSQSLDFLTHIKSNARSFPSDLTVLLVDFDSQGDLVSTYHILTPHSFVQVDAQGKVLHSWQKGSTLDDMIAEIK